MIERNILGIESRFGYRTFRLLEGDITKLTPAVDVLVTSAFAGGYGPVPGTIFGALHSKLGLSVSSLQQDAAFDMRGALGIWVSAELSGLPFRRLMCAELVGAALPINEVLQNAFVGLLMLEAKGIPLRTVAMPVMGGGNQGLEADTVIPVLLAAARDFAERSRSLESIMFVELNASRVMALSQAMDRHLGRSRVALPRSQVVEAIRADVRNDLLHAPELFEPDAIQLKDDWLRLLEGQEVRSVELGVLSRRLVELVVRRYGQPSTESLPNRIRALEQSGVAPWICGYMQVLRHFGNESAHESIASRRHPPLVEQPDLALCLLCIERVLQFCIAYPKLSQVAGTPTL